MRRFFDRRIGRAVIAGPLLVLQLHLLSIAEFHGHEVVEAFAARATSVREGSGKPHAAAKTDLLCTACQVVRRSAARPAMCAPTPRPTAIVSLEAAPVHNAFHPYQPRVSQGRAPPLS